MFSFLRRNSWLKLVEDTAKSQTYVCPCCNSKHIFYKVNISKIHIDILMKIRAYCLNNNTHEFQIKDLDRELSLSKTEYWNLNVLCRFGLLYRISNQKWNKIKWWYYWINMKTTLEFIQNKWKVAENYVRNVNEKTHILSENRIFIDEIKWAKEFLKSNNIPDYVEYL